MTDVDEPPRAVGEAPRGDGEAPRGDGEAPRAPRLGAVGTLRWLWRQLTSMRTALMLLLLLAVAALPGSVLPQRPQAPEKVASYIADHPGIGPVLDRLGFFDVFASVWFSAIYLLLFISLIGCILPRSLDHVRELRSRPPAAPRSLARFHPVRVLVPAADPLAVATQARHLLVTTAVPGVRRYRADVRTEPSGAVTVSAERGYLREAGNLVFHVALVGVLVAVAWGHLVSYSGQALVVQGHGFANSMLAYDTFQSGPWFDPADLEPFSFTVDNFTASFTADAKPLDFAAALTVRSPGHSPRAATVKVNRPLIVDGAKVYLSGNGYAPSVTVRDGTGAVAFAGAVPFLPQDGVYTSQGVIKVPDTAGSQLGFTGYLLPTAVEDNGVLSSAYPQPGNPMLVLAVYQGDLGLDNGIPQNVYQLDLTKMSAVEDEDGSPLVLRVQPGETVQLPDGLGSISFDSLPRFVSMDLRYDPATVWVLVFALLAIAGLAASLFLPRRRVWIRVHPAGVAAAAPVSPDGPPTPGTHSDVTDGTSGDVVDAGANQRPADTVIDVGGLARHEDGGMGAAVDDVARRLADRFDGRVEWPDEAGAPAGQGRSPGGVRIEES